MNSPRDNFLMELEAKSNSIPRLIGLIGWEVSQLNRHTDSIFWISHSGYPTDENFWNFFAKDVIARIDMINQIADSLRKKIV